MADVARSGSGAAGNISGGYVTSLGISTFSVTAGGNLALYAGLSRGQAVATTPTITWNGVGLTSLQNLATTWARGDLARLVAPATGTQTLSASWSGACPAVLGVAAFANVHQTTPEETADTVTNTGSSTAPSTGAVTSSADGATIGFAVADNAGGSSIGFTDPQAYTNEWRVESGSHEAPSAFSTELGGSSNTHTFTLSGSFPWLAIGVHIRAAPPPDAPAIDPSLSAFPKFLLRP